MPKSISILSLLLVFLISPMIVASPSQEDKKSLRDFSCETFLAKIPIKYREKVAWTSYLPYFESSFDVVEIMNEGDRVQFVIVSKSSGTFGFSSTELFDFWLSEILFERELNHALKMDRMRYGGGPMRSEILRVNVNTKFMDRKKAEQILGSFLDRVQGLNLVTWNWKSEIKETQLLQFLKSFPNTKNFYNSELIGRWGEKFARYYTSLKPARRVLFTRNFFNPEIPLTPDEALIQKYLFQGNKWEQDRVFDEMRETIESWFNEVPPHLKGSMANGSVERQIYYSVSAGLGKGATVASGKSVLESSTVDIDPVTRLDQLEISEALVERLESQGYYAPDKLMFYSAKNLVEELNLTREEFIELADGLFADGIFLKIDWTWDHARWNVLKDRTYLRMPKRATPKNGIDYSPAPRRMYGEFE